MAEHPPSPTELTDLVVADDPEPWAAAGFAVEGRQCRIGGVTVHLAGPGAGRGLISWRFAGLGGPIDLDGIPADVGSAPAGDAPTHPNGATGIDHVVVLSPDLDRTAASFGEHGLDVRRVREVDAAQYGFPARQVFFRAGEVILEVIGAAEPETDPARAARPAKGYGLAVTVGDIEGLPGLLGEQLGAVKDAVQPGRRIATLRHRAVGLSVAVAFMSPGPGAA